MKKKLYRFLRWSEKHTKTDMVYLAKGSFWLAVGQGIYAVTSFFLAIAFARFLSPSDYGTYKFALAVFSILSIATLSGINQSLVQAVARGFEGGLKNALFFRMRWGLVGAAGGFVLSVYYFLHGNTVFALSFLILAFFVPFADSLTLYLSVWTGRKRFDISTACSSITYVLSALSLIATLFFTHNIIILLFVYCVSLSLLRLFFHIATIRLSPLNDKYDAAVIPSGIHFSVMNIFPLIAQQMDKILLFHYLGAAQVAVYSFSIAIPDQFKSILKGLQTIIIPKFAQKETQKVKESISARMLPLMGMLTLISLLYFFGAKYVYLLFFPAYTASIPYSQVYGISIIALALILPHSFLQAKLATRELYQFNGIRALAQIIFLVIGAYAAGIWGVITARVLSDFFGLGALFILTHRYREQSFLQSSPEEL